MAKIALIFITQFPANPNSRELSQFHSNIIDFMPLCLKSPILCTNNPTPLAPV